LQVYRPAQMLTCLSFLQAGMMGSSQNDPGARAGPLTARLTAPTEDDVAEVIARIVRQVTTALNRRGLLSDSLDEAGDSPLLITQLARGPFPGWFPPVRALPGPLDGRVILAFTTPLALPPASCYSRQ